MSWLDDLIAQQNGGGILNGMYPSPLQGEAQPPQTGSVFQTGAAPFGFAGLAPRTPSLPAGGNGASAWTQPPFAAPDATAPAIAMALGQPPSDYGTYGSRNFAPFGFAALAPQAPSPPAGNDGAAPSPQLSEAELAQQAREVAAARLARSWHGTRAEVPPPDYADIAKSAGIGVVNGTIGLIGAIPQASDWAHGAFNNGIDRVFNGISGPPNPSPQPPNINAGASPASIRNFIERHFTGEFYQPNSTAGRYAETIGEMAPVILGEGAGAIGQGLARGAGAGAALLDLGSTLAKHAALPGVAVQALEDAFPDSPAGQWLQKAWPLARRGLPLALAAMRSYRAPTAP